MRVFPEIVFTRVAGCWSDGTSSSASFLYQNGQFLHRSVCGANLMYLVNEVCPVDIFAYLGILFQVGCFCDALLTFPCVMAVDGASAENAR